MKKQIFIYKLILLLIIVTGFGCKKLIEIGPPRDQLASNSVFLDTSTATAAIIGMYSRIANPTPATDMGTAVTMFNCMSSDEAYNYAFTFYDEFKNNALTPQVYYVDGFWSVMYSDVFMTNSIITSIASSPLPAEFIKRGTGEAKFMRALCYFYLVNEFGAVPLVLSTDVFATSQQPQDSVDVVYDQIEKDLTDAASALPATLDLYQGRRVRATSWAAKALLARVYLYRGKWQQAEAMATAVIDNPGLFKLSEDLTQTFYANSESGILQFVNAIQTSWIASALYPFQGSLTPKYVLNEPLYGSFETGDKRRTAWTQIMTYNSTDYPIPAKYRFLSSSSPVEYNQVLRMAEQYLIRAEARTRQSNFEGALADLNKIRLRSGLGKVTTTDKSSLMAAIEHENQVEFFCEWGHRWLDLKRWPGLNNPAVSRADEVLSKLKGELWQATDALYPIPQSARNANVHLAQNPGYTK